MNGGAKRRGKRYKKAVLAVFAYKQKAFRLQANDLSLIGEKLCAYKQNLTACKFKVNDFKNNMVRELATEAQGHGGQRSPLSLPQGERI